VEDRAAAWSFLIGRIRVVAATVAGRGVRVQATIDPESPPDRDAVTGGPVGSPTAGDGLPEGGIFPFGLLEIVPRTDRLVPSEPTHRHALGIGSYG